MLPIHTILHPTDFSERSAYAFPLACALARDYGARLVVLHVVDYPPVVTGEGMVPPNPEVIRSAAQEQLDRLAAPRDDVRAEHRLAEGDAAAEVVRVADEIKADLVVMGTHGRTGLGRLLMGSVAEQVVRKAPCPVLTLTTPFGASISPAADEESAGTASV